MEWNYDPNWWDIIRKGYKRDKAAFEAKTGVCYIDRDGKEYTYADLLAITGSEDAARALFEDMDDTLEMSLQGNWYFTKCKRCGAWNYNKEFGLFKRSETICPRCRPVKTNGVIELDRDPYDDKRKFYAKRKATFVPGITTLIGCNGIGKTTLLNMIKDQLKEKGVPMFLFDNMSKDGGGHAGANMLSRVCSGVAKEEEDSVELAATLWCSSEGECIKDALIRFANKVLREFKRYDGFGEYWVLFDAIDSGLSLDVIEDVKQYLFRALLEKLPGESDVYIISSSNSYELSEGTQMFSISKTKYVSIKSYDSYKKAIYESLESKEKRDGIFEKEENK